MQRETSWCILFMPAHFFPPPFSFCSFKSFRTRRISSTSPALSSGVRPLPPHSEFSLSSYLIGYVVSFSSQPSSIHSTRWFFFFFLLQQKHFQLRLAIPKNSNSKQFYQYQKLAGTGVFTMGQALCWA